MSAAPKPEGVRSCEASPGMDQYVLAFAGDSLPAANIHLIPGIVKIGSGDMTSDTTSLRGLIWADGICNGSGTFKLFSDNRIERTKITPTDNPDIDCEDASSDEEKDNCIGSNINNLNQQWDWEGQNFPGYGQMVTRGIRGTGLDTFRRW